MSHQPNAPPAYEDAPKYPTMYTDSNAPQGAAYEPNMANPQHGAVPPPPGQGQQQQGGNTTTTFVYMSDGGQHRWGPRPQNAFCPNCRQQVMSKVKYSAGLLTWLIFGGCLLFGCWLGCCLIPFCMDDCQDCEHYCTNCKAFLGQYKRI